MLNDIFLSETENNGVLIIKPLKPYYEWAEQVFKSKDGMEVIDEPTRAYLIPEYETEEELDWNCDDWFPQIFVEELNNWCRDTDLWPKGRSWNEFKRWFSWTWYPMVFNTEDMHPDIM